MQFGNEAYFMSAQEENAVIGRIVRDRAEAVRQLELLTAEAESLGQQFSNLGGELQESPQNVTIEGESLETRFPRSDFLSEIFDAGKIKVLCGNIRKNILQRDDMTRKLKNSGLE